MVRRDGEKQAVSSSSSDEKLYYLDLNNPTLTQPIDANEDLANAKFVEVAVVKVTNPNKHPVSFKVYYQTGSDEKIYLGSFGLFPSDNPGKFIVSTKDKVRNAGAIVLTLVQPDKVANNETIRVGVKKIKLINGRNF